MTIAVFSIEWYYWLPVLTLLGLGTWLLRARPFDFVFVVLMLLSQYATHSVLAFGLIDPISIFCILFYLAFVLGGQERWRFKSLPKLPALQPTAEMEECYIFAARWYLLLYYCVRLAVYPFFSGQLELDERLSAQQDNVVLFVLGLGVSPALAAMLYSAMRPGGRLSGFDGLVLMIAAIGILGSGSKGGLLPVLLAFIAVASFLQQRVLKYRFAVVAVLVGVVGTVVLLRRFFPDLALSEIGSLMLYRVAAGTDSLEYLDALGLRPGDFPFSGIGALFPSVARRLGYAYDYSPGVWLHGSRFGNWDGFGPNSGIVLDYFGNLGWFGVLVGLGLGLYVRALRSSPNAITCSFLAITVTAVTDIAMFDIAFPMWLFVLLGVTLYLRSGIRLRFSMTLPRLRWRPASVPEAS